VSGPDDGFLIEILLIALLILVNGFFAGAEIAVLSARRGHVQALAVRDRRAAALLRLKADADRFLATVQIGVTVVGTLASAVGGVAAIERLEPWFASIPWPWARQLAEPLAVGSVVIAIAYLSLVVGELLPKSLAVRHAEAIALRVARPIEMMSRALRPMVAILTASSGLFLRIIGRRDDQQRSGFVTLDDLRAIAAEAEEQGLLKSDVVSGAIEFHDQDVREILTPRGRVDGIPMEASLEEALRRVRESGHSRFPVYQGSLDDIQGFVYARDLFEAEHAGRGLDLRLVKRPVLLVPASKKASALLTEMRAQRSHLAVVVDEHGTTAGLVTLEDLLEVIVGEIEDEHGEPAPRVQRESDGTLDVDGALPVRELNVEWGLDLPESSAYVTVAGLILDRLGAVPRGGERLEVAGRTLTVRAMEGYRVDRVSIGPAKPAADATQAS
jgi:putative hemolysin